MLKKYSKIKFHENLWSGSRVVPCARTDEHRNMIKLSVAIFKFANAPKSARKPVERQAAILYKLAHFETVNLAESEEMCC